MSKIEHLLQLDERRSKMIQYLLLKVDEQDWHGVADAAMDLRDIDAEELGYKTAKEEDDEIPF